MSAAKRTVASTLSEMGVADLMHLDGKTLMYGDTIALYTEDDASGFMMAEGTVDKKIDLGPTVVPDNYRMCLFRIYPMLQYSARLELQAALENRVTEPPAAKKASDKRVRMAEASLKKEEDFNQQEFERRLGTTVQYGHIVQLRHVKSKSFLTVYPKKLARLENSCLRIDLATHGSFNCWLIIKPRFKVHSIGDSVEIEDYVLFEFRQRSGEYVHTSSEREVNCAQKGTSWKTMYYASYNSNPDLVEIGTAVRVFHPQTQSFLTCEVPSHHPSESFSSSKDVSKRSVHTDAARAAGSNSVDDLEPAVVLKETDIGMQHRDSNFLWSIQQEREDVGGLATWTGRYVLEHLNSGEYLTALDAEKGEDGKTSMRAGLTSDRTKAVRLAFKSAKKTGGKDSIGFQVGIYFRTAPGGDEILWLEHGVVDEACCFGSAANFLTVNLNSVFNEASAFVLEKVQKDILPVVQRSGVLASELKACLVEQSDFTLADVSNDSISRVVVAAGAVINFLIEGVDSGFTITSDMTLFDKVRVVSKASNDNLNATRQTLMCEQRLLEFAFELLERAKKLLVSCENQDITGLMSGEKKMHYKLVEALRGECCCLYHVIELTFSGHSENQLYAARWMAPMIEDIDDDIGSAMCLKELLQNNVELLENGVKRKHVGLFLDLIREKGMKPKYLKLLLAIAATGSEAVQSKQNMIHDMLLVENPDLLIQTMVDENETSDQKLPISEKQLKNYITDDGGEVKAHGLLHSVNLVQVTWTTKHAETTPKALFGADCLALEKFSAGQNPNPGVGYVDEDNGKIRDVEMRRAQIFDYYYYQLKLFSALCVDRNYLTIKKIEREMTFLILASTMTNDQLPVRLRTQFCRLLMALWIDRAPQRVQIIPMQTRAWHKPGAKGYSGPKPPSDSNKFALLQAYLQYFFDNLDENQKAHMRRQNKFTTSMSDVLRLLVQFGFYSSVEEIQNITVPLILIVDGENDSIDRAEEFEEDEDEEEEAEGDERHLTESGTAGGGDNSKAVVISSGKSSSNHKKNVAAVQTADDDDDEEEFESDDDEEELDMWEKMARFLDSKEYMIFIIAATMVSVVLSIFGLTQTEEEGWQVAIEYFFLWLFTQDVVLRIMIVGYWLYLIDWLCLVDFLIVAIDWTGIIIGAVSPEATIIVKMFRLARLVRILRIIRAARMAKKIQYDRETAVKVIYPKRVRSRRYNADKETKLLMHGKLVQVKMLRILSKLSLELRLSKLFEAFGKTVSEEYYHIDDLDAVDSIQVLFETDYFNDLDIGHIKDSNAERAHARPLKDIKDVAIDLCLYQYPPLAAEALLVLVSQYRQKQTLVDAFLDVNLIIDDVMIDQFHVAQHHLKSAIALIEAFEIWGGRTDSESQDKLKTVISDIEHLRKACGTPENAVAVMQVWMDLLYILFLFLLLSLFFSLLLFFFSVLEPETNNSNNMQHNTTTTTTTTTTTAVAVVVLFPPLSLERGDCYY